MEAPACRCDGPEPMTPTLAVTIQLKHPLTQTRLPLELSHVAERFGGLLPLPAQRSGERGLFLGDLKAPPLPDLLLHFAEEKEKAPSDYRPSP